MTNDLDTLLTALYVEIDDHVALPRRGRGRRPRLTDAELACLAVAQVLLGFDSEHRWIRFGPTAGSGICSATCRTSPATTSG